MGIFHPFTELIRFKDLSSSIPHVHELSKKKTRSGKHFVKRKSFYPGNRSNIEYGGLVCVKVHLTLFFFISKQIISLGAWIFSKRRRFGWFYGRQIWGKRFDIDSCSRCCILSEKQQQSVGTADSTLC